MGLTNERMQKTMCDMCRRVSKLGELMHYSVTSDKLICSDCYEKFIEIRKVEKELELKLSQAYKQGFRDSKRSIDYVPETNDYFYSESLVEDPAVVDRINITEEPVDKGWGFDIVIDGDIVMSVKINDVNKVRINTSTGEGGFSCG